jgi:hypothetical protein
VRIPALPRALALGIVTCACTAALGGTASAAGVTSGSVLMGAKSAIAQQTSVHVAFSVRSGASSTTERIVVDVGVAVGAETAGVGTSHLAVRVTPGYAYVQGNSSGLTTLFGLSAREAKKAGAAWVAWKAGTKQYANLKADVTLSAVTALLPKVKGTKVSTEIIDGARRYALRWTTAATSTTAKVSNTLTISTGALTLPVEQISTAAGGTKATTELSNWGEPVSVSAPPVTSTIASSKITG